METDNLSSCDLSERETGRGVQHAAVPNGTGIFVSRKLLKYHGIQE